MKLVVGLGNPGEEYRGTRHNIGAEVIELLAEKRGVTLKRKWRLRCWVGKVRIGDTAVIIARPRTFMNLSGNAVASLARWYRCEPHELLVASDDINLDLGRLRIRAGGSSGGHKGLDSIIAALGSDTFPRLRIGVGKGGDDRVGHVLGGFSAAERAEACMARERAAEAIEAIIMTGLGVAMNRYNTREPEA
ncbi:MAG: aminoacyl-tRNA hydrolase [Candidatus Aureabacteria bacterium]|nr:aminoacyl-tRNA hydrolase [Candidatus Auribacterota bacterium]